MSGSAVCLGFLCGEDWVVGGGVGAGGVGGVGGVGYCWDVDFGG